MNGELEAVRRLKDKFSPPGKDFSRGLGPTDLSIGDVVDILQIYTRTATGSEFGDFASVARVAELTLVGSDLPDKDDYITEIAKIRNIKLQGGITPDDLDRNSPLYSLKVDLDRMSQVEAGGGVELTHYPGGIVISRYPGSAKRYRVVLTNRQSSDSGRDEISQAFWDTGLPLMDNINPDFGKRRIESVPVVEVGEKLAESDEAVRRSSILNWDSSEEDGQPLNITWLYPKDKSEFQRLPRRRKRTEEEALASVPQVLIGKARLIAHRTKLGLYYTTIRPEDLDAAPEEDETSELFRSLFGDRSADYVYAPKEDPGLPNLGSEIYADRRDTPPFGYSAEIITPARVLNYAKIAETETPNARISWRKDGSSTVGTYRVEHYSPGGNYHTDHRLFYYLDVNNHDLSMTLSRQSGQNLTAVSVNLDRDGFDNRFVEVSYVEKAGGDTYEFYNFDAEGRLTNAQLRLHTGTNRPLVAADPRLGDLHTWVYSRESQLYYHAQGDQSFDPRGVLLMPAFINLERSIPRLIQGFTSGSTTLLAELISLSIYKTSDQRERPFRTLRSALIASR